MSQVDRIVVIGASLGGIDALGVVLRGVHCSERGTIAVVQHRAEDSGAELVRLLERDHELSVVEAEDKAALNARQISLAPPGYHLLVSSHGYSLSTEGKVQGARPSIDVLFESAARAFGERVTAVVLTSASCDGVSGAAAIEAVGGRVVVQDPASAKSPILPAATVAACRSAHSLPLSGIAPFLLQQGAL